jgi:predicted nucleic acid-binding protein
MPIRTTLDSNVLVYAALEPGSAKGMLAANLIRLATPNGVLAVQALLEFVAVVRRRAPNLTAKAVQQADAWAQVFETAPTTPLIMADALRLVNAHQFQVGDAVIWSAAGAAGATVFLSEDLQDGMNLDGMRVVNPFSRSETELAALLSY